MRKTVPTNITIDDLLESLNQKENTEDSPSVELKNDVLSFIITFNLKAGNEAVSKRLICDLYYKWSKNPVERTQFFYEITKYIPTRQIGPKSLYSIDTKAWKITEDIQRLVLANKRDKTKSRTYKKHFDNFLKKYSLAPGSYYIESYILYYLYDKWVYGIKRQNPLGENQFFNFCKLYFKYKRNSESRVMWFGVDEKALLKVISLDQINRIRSARKRRYGKKQEKPLEKSKGKVSRN